MPAIVIPGNPNPSSEWRPCCVKGGGGDKAEPPWLGSKGRGKGGQQWGHHCT